MPHVPRERPRPPSAFGYVYLIEMQGVYKIGRSKSWSSRNKAYRGMPFPVRLVCLLRSYQMQQLEGELHARYASKRIGGEWFRLTAADGEEIKAHPNRVDELPDCLEDARRAEDAEQYDDLYRDIGSGQFRADVERERQRRRRQQ